MPNPKNSKGGRKNKRANSSGDEQENGAGALAVAGAAGAAAGGALAAAALSIALIIGSIEDALLRRAKEPGHESLQHL